MARQIVWGRGNIPKQTPAQEGVGNGVGNVNMLALVLLGPTLRLGRRRQEAVVFHLPDGALLSIAVIALPGLQEASFSTTCGTPGEA